MAKQITRFVHRGMMMIWHSTINIHITNTHNMLELLDRQMIVEPNSNSSSQHLNLPEHVLTQLTEFHFLLFVLKLESPRTEVLLAYLFV